MATCTWLSAMGMRPGRLSRAQVEEAIQTAIARKRLSLCPPTPSNRVLRESRDPAGPQPAASQSA